MCSPVDTVSLGQDVLGSEIVIHVSWVYPNTVAANLSCVVSSFHFFDAEGG